MKIVDRFEDEIAVIEDGDKRFSIKKSLLPKQTAEGDVIVETEKGYMVDKEATRLRREEAIKRLKELL